MQTDQVEIINQKIDAVMQASHKLAEKMYQEASAGPQAGPGPQQPGEQGQEEHKGDESKEGAVDADFEVVDDDKK